MNRACLSCGKIITLPDIPLPEGYTQKCDACGYKNPVADDYPHAPSPASAPSGREGAGDLSFSSKREDLWDSTLDHSIDEALISSPQPYTPVDSAAVDDLEQRIMLKFERRLAELESKLSTPIPTDGAASPGLYNYEKEIQKHVAAGEVVVGTQNATVFQTCRNQLQEGGFTVHKATSLTELLAIITQSYLEVIVLDQSLLKSGEEGKQVLKLIKRTPLAIRRCQTVLLFSPGITTCEPQVFYQWGIDFNIHPKETPRIGGLLKEVLQLKKEMLAPYLGSLTAIF